MTDEPLWLPRVLVDAMHYAQLDEHGGSHGLRDVNALEAALARPRQKHAYDASVDLADLAAAYAFGVARAHPYVDGNKRTAYLVAAVFLDLNGHALDRTDPEIVSAMLALADGSLSEESLAAWIREAMLPEPPGVV